MQKRSELTTEELFELAESPRAATPDRRAALTRLLKVIDSEAEKERWEKIDDALSAAVAVDAIVADNSTRAQELWQTYLEYETRDLATVRDESQPSEARKTALNHLYPYGDDAEAVEVRAWRVHFELPDLGIEDPWLKEQDANV